MSTSEGWARGIQSPPVLSPERLPGKLTLVQTEMDILGVVQLGDRGDGTFCTCPVKEVVLVSEIWQMCGVDSWGCLEDQFGILGRHTEAQGTVPGTESRAPCRRSGGNLGGSWLAKWKPPELGMLRPMDLKSAQSPLTRALQSQLCPISLPHLGIWMDTYPCSSLCPKLPPTLPQSYSFNPYV